MIYETLYLVELLCDGSLQPKYYLFFLSCKS